MMELQRAIDAGARDLPHDAQRAPNHNNEQWRARASDQSLDRSKGRLPPSAILAESSSLSMVISPTLDFSRAISSRRGYPVRVLSRLEPRLQARDRATRSSLATETCCGSPGLTQSDCSGGRARTERLPFTRPRRARIALARTVGRLRRPFGLAPFIIVV